MSSQINFYLSDVDHHNLVQELSKVRGISYVLPPLTSTNLESRDLNSLEPWKPGEHSPFLFLREQRPLLKLMPSGQKQMSFFVDEAESSVVEYSRAIQRENAIQRGRLYYTSRYTGDDGYIHEKSPAFIGFAKQIFKIAKKFCGASHEGFYVGPDATVLHRQGFKLPLN
jgi:hypothetical protein